MAETRREILQQDESPRTAICGPQAGNTANHPAAVPSASVSAKPLLTTPLQDLANGLAKWPLWGRLGWLDIKRRYRRTIIGPFWTSISLLVFVMVIGAVGSGLLSKQTADYLPFLVSGMVVWTLLSSIMAESSNVFIAGSGLMRQMRIEFSLLVYALLWRNVIVFLHNMLVYVMVMTVCAPEKFSPAIILVVPGIAILLVNGTWIAILLGMLTARFRDVQQLTQTVVQIAMFVTPLFWPADSLHGMRRTLFVGINPLYYLLSIAREPLLGSVPDATSYTGTLVITLMGWCFTYLCFRRFRSRITYWL
jgi:ABC-type polysaccharide/polyol phosphate export permease